MKVANNVYPQCCHLMFCGLINAQYHCLEADADGGGGCPHGILITRYTPVPLPSPTKKITKKYLEFHHH